MKYTHQVLTAYNGPAGYITNTLSGEQMLEMYPVVPVLESWDHAEIPVELLSAMSYLRAQDQSYLSDGREGCVWSEVYVRDHAQELVDRLQELVTAHPVVLQ